MAKRPAGWKNDPARHALAAKGVSSIPIHRNPGHHGLKARAEWGGLVHPRTIKEWEDYGYWLAHGHGDWGFDEKMLHWTEIDMGKQADESVLVKAATLVAGAEEGPVLMQLALVGDEDYHASKMAFIGGYVRAAKEVARKHGRKV